jgi:hypothetical protein
VCLYRIHVLGRISSAKIDRYSGLHCWEANGRATTDGKRAEW